MTGEKPQIWMNIQFRIYLALAEFTAAIINMGDAVTSALVEVVIVGCQGQTSLPLHS